MTTISSHRQSPNTRTVYACVLIAAAAHTRRLAHEQGSTKLHTHAHDAASYPTPRACALCHRTGLALLHAKRKGLAAHARTHDAHDAAYAERRIATKQPVQAGHAPRASNGTCTRTHVCVCNSRTHAIRGGAVSARGRMHLRSMADSDAAARGNAPDAARRVHRWPLAARRRRRAAMQALQNNAAARNVIITQDKGAFRQHCTHTMCCGAARRERHRCAAGKTCLCVSSDAATIRALHIIIEQASATRMSMGCLHISA